MDQSNLVCGVTRIAFDFKGELSSGNDLQNRKNVLKLISKTKFSFCHYLNGAKIAQCSIFVVIM